VVGEERMRSGHWSGSVIRVSFNADGWVTGRISDP